MNKSVLHRAKRLLCTLDVQKAAINLVRQPHPKKAGIRTVLPVARLTFSSLFPVLRLFYSKQSSHLIVNICVVIIPFELLLSAALREYGYRKTCVGVG